MDYQDTFSSVAKLTSMWILISLVTTHHWLLHQLDVKNIFLNGVLDEEVYWRNQQILLPRGSRGRCAG